jgi:4-carboxymuconolactone decarboxylase
MERMEGLHPELAAWILEDGYGRVLSRPGLTGRERELLAVAALAALPGAGPQLESHERGARRLGATAAEVRSARYVAERAVRRGV